MSDTLVVQAIHAMTVQSSRNTILLLVAMIVIAINMVAWLMPKDRR